MPRDEFRKDLTILANEVESGNVSAVEELTDSLLKRDLVWERILNEGLLPGIIQVRDKFERLEVFLPDIIFASDAIRAGIAKIRAVIPENEQKNFRKGTAVIGTVQGDIHDVGKTIVATLLAAFGFEVHDLGIDVSSDTFISRARELKAELIFLSCLMTTALARQKEVIEDLVRLGIRDHFKVLVGGGAVTETWAEEIGADAYGNDASEAVDLALSFAPKTSQ
jgi:methanogenic corrinoid protein MtbC1